MKRFGSMIIWFVAIATLGSCSKSKNNEDSTTKETERDQYSDLQGPYTGYYKNELLLNGGRNLSFFVDERNQSVFEGDVLLSPDMHASASAYGLGIIGSSSLWPKGVIPYTIAPGLPNREAILEAMAHWQEKTPITFAERTREEDYVAFIASEDRCYSYLGRTGGSQSIRLAPNCGQSAVIHEIGHAVGLFHEQSRSDRDAFIEVLWDHIEPRFRSQYEKSSPWAINIGNYDLKSIMHYQTWMFSVDGQPTFRIKNGDDFTMNDGGLSDGDVETVRRMYGFRTETNPRESLTEQALALVNERLGGNQITMTSVTVTERRKHFLVTLKAGDDEGTVALSEKLSATANSKIILSLIPRYLFPDLKLAHGP